MIMRPLFNPDPVIMRTLARLGPIAGAVLFGAALGWLFVAWAS